MAILRAITLALSNTLGRGCMMSVIRLYSTSTLLKLVLVLYHLPNIPGYYRQSSNTRCECDSLNGETSVLETDFDEYGFSGGPQFLNLFQKEPPHEVMQIPPPCVYYIVPQH